MKQRKKIFSIVIFILFSITILEARNLDKDIETLIVKYNKKFESKNIIISIMDNKTGKIIYLSDPKIATQYEFEPGSIIKPISISLVLDHNKVKTNELIDAYNDGKKDKNGYYPRGKYKLNRWTIGDDHKIKKHNMTLEDIIIHSSNIGTLILAQRLTGEEFFNGFKSFGLSKKTDIDIANEKRGLLHHLYQYKLGEKSGKDNVFKATDSYGQGITVTFMQMMKAYSVFNDNGIITTPYLKLPFIVVKKQIIKPTTANTIKNYLISNVKKGTAKKAYIKGIEIGAKTGTANIVENGKYVRKYISSCFGFVNFDNHKYTIGVSIIDPIHSGKHWYYYYASQSAVPIFKDVSKLLINSDNTK